MDVDNSLTARSVVPDGSLVIKNSFISKSKDTREREDVIGLIIIIRVYSTIVWDQIGLLLFTTGMM